MQIPHALKSGIRMLLEMRLEIWGFRGSKGGRPFAMRWICGPRERYPRRTRSHTMKSIAIILAATMAACQATTASVPGPSHAQTTSAEAAAFDPFRTFGCRLAEQPPSPYELSARSFEVERRVHDMVVAELVRKGYTETGADADLLIRISSGT